MCSMLTPQRSYCQSLLLFQTDVTGEHTAILLAQVDHDPEPDTGVAAPSFKKAVSTWLDDFVDDARRRLVSLLAFTFSEFTVTMVLTLLQDAGRGEGKAVSPKLAAGELGYMMTPHDLKRLDM